MNLRYTIGILSVIAVAGLFLSSTVKADDNLPPGFYSPVGSYHFSEGVHVSIPVDAYDPDGTYVGLMFDFMGLNLHYNSSIGAIEATAKGFASGEYSFVVTAIDADGATTPLTVNVTIDEAAYSLGGSVRHAPGFPIKGAHVTLFDENDVAIRDEFTNRTGRYSFYNLPAGTYTVKAEKDGIVFDESEISVELSESHPDEENATFTLVN